MWLFCLLNAPGILVHGYFTTNNYYISTVPSLNCFPLFVMFHVLWMMHFQIIILKDFYRCFFCAFLGCFFQIFTHFYVNILGFFPFSVMSSSHSKTTAFSSQTCSSLVDCPINQYDNMLYNILNIVLGRVRYVKGMQANVCSKYLRKKFCFIIW